jgi:hypothetical protein
VANMQAKMESLTTTNALMKEDLAIARGSLYRSQEENKRLLSQLDRTLLAQRNDSSPTYDTLSKVFNSYFSCFAFHRGRLKLPKKHLAKIRSKKVSKADFKC